MSIFHDEATSRYVLLDDAGEHAGEIEYERSGDTLILIRAEVPPERRGGGYGVRLVKETLEMIRDQHHGTIRPVCPFIAKFIAKNPEYQSLLD